MLKRLRYFYKKQKLAIKLARYDLLFLLNGLASFKSVIKPASFFVKPSPLPIPCRIQIFLATRRGFLPDLLASEFSVLALSRGAPLLELPLPQQSYPAGKSMIRENLDLADSPFYLSLFQEVVQTDFPQYAESITALKLRVAAAEDMRLYAADLEHLLSLSADSPAFLPLQVEWIKTSAENLFLESPQNFVLASTLSYPAQQNFAALFAHLLFDKSLFAADWQAVAVAANGQVALLDFDKLYVADWQDKLFALQPEAEPTTLLRLKLRHALLLLQNYCPKIDLLQVFAPYQAQIRPQTPFASYDKNFVGEIEAYGYDLGSERIIAAQPVSSLMARLLQPKSHPKSWLDKTAILYWGPLIIAAFVLFILFQI